MARSVVLLGAIGLGVSSVGSHARLAKHAPRTLDSRVSTPIFIRGARVIDAPLAVIAPARVASVRPRPTPKPAETEPIACVPQWQRTANGDLDRCLDGEGEGCVGVGDDYERGCDAYSSIKWYRRGCRLGSESACGALTRLGEVTPPPRD